ncbi:MAG: glutamate--tRNA ligase [Syntrophales bacterium]|nr:glutamate--tRNA ligase [Syntrophales bacterium]
MGTPRVRFAPSPTGELHVGNARTALFNWLFARRYGGVFVLRIEDTDRERSTLEHEERLLSDLKWLNLDWDEGPDRGGPYGPYRQSERASIYQDILKSLIDKNLVYPCYCTEEELEADRRRLLARGLAPRYTGRCRNLSPQERREKEAQGRKPAWRFAVSPGPIQFIDLIRGTVHFAGESIGDFIIFRSTGVPAYNFACVVDDYMMHITHVIRGEDHLTNTASQILLYRALGFHQPIFAHHALILGQDRAKLSKRHQAVTVDEYRRQGILPQALVNYLALLGASLEGGEEVCPLDELVTKFSIEKVGRSGAIFDEGKLKWLNTLYLRREPFHRIFPHLKPFLNSGVDEKNVEAIFDLVKENISSLRDVISYLNIFGTDIYEIGETERNLLAEERAKKVIQTAVEILSGLPAEENNFFSLFYTTLRKRTGQSGKEVLMPLRIALTGRTSGPELDKIFSFLGREKILQRLQRVIG